MKKLEVGLIKLVFFIMPGITLSVVKLVFTNIDNHINMSILSSNSLPVEDVNGTGMAKLCTDN